MNKVRSPYKEEALSLLSRGEWKRALEAFQKHLEMEPDDLRTRLKRAELLEKLGKRKEALEEYRDIAEAYANDGFLLQAISVNKMILRINPSLREIHERLAQLYARRVQTISSSRPLPYIPLLSDLTQEELQPLLDRVQINTYPKDALICQEGEPGDSLMVICRGKVGIYKRSKGKEVCVRELGEGDCFGELGFFLDRNRQATVKSLAECELMELNRKELEAIIQKYPRVNEVLEDLFQKRVLDNLLALSPLFSPLSVADRKEVAKRFRLLNLPAETLIFKGGDPPRSLYLIQRGEVEIFTQDRHKNHVRLGNLGGGDFFGEIGVLFNTPRMAFAKTTQPTDLLELDKENFDRLLKKFPQLQSVTKEISSRRLIRMKEALSKVETGRAEEFWV